MTTIMTWPATAMNQAMHLPDGVRIVNLRMSLDGKFVEAQIANWPIETINAEDRPMRVSGGIA